MLILEGRPDRGRISRRFAELDVARLDADVPLLVPDLPGYAARIWRAAQRHFGMTAGRKDLPLVLRDEGGIVRLAHRELVVRFTKDTRVTDRRRILARRRLQALRRSPFTDGRELTVVHETGTGAALFDVANELMSVAEIVFAAPSFLSEYKRAGPPAGEGNDWHLNRISMQEAWGIVAEAPNPADISVAVIDDGVDVDHAHLQSSMSSDPVGRDFSIEEGLPGHLDPRPKRLPNIQDPEYTEEGSDDHGTLCAGIVVSDGIGGAPAGAAPQCSVLPVKIFDGNAFAADPAISAAIRYSSRHAQVISCSWTGPFADCIDSAIQGAAIRRVPLICALGNDLPLVGYPARDSRTIAVGACTHTDERAVYSPEGDTIDVVAPSDDGRGVTIFSTDVSGLGKGRNPGVSGGSDAGLFYEDFGGTSAATALVASVAALCLIVEPLLTHNDIREILRQSADKISPQTGDYDNNGYSSQFGYGRVNAERAVSLASKWFAS